MDLKTHGRKRICKYRRDCRSDLRLQFLGRSDARETRHGVRSRPLCALDRQFNSHRADELGGARIFAGSRAPLLVRRRFRPADFSKQFAANNFLDLPAFGRCKRSRRMNAYLEQTVSPGLLFLRRQCSSLMLATAGRDTSRMPAAKFFKSYFQRPLS